MQQQSREDNVRPPVKESEGQTASTDPDSAGDFNQHGHEHGHGRPPEKPERKTYIAWPRETGRNDDLNARGYDALAAIATPSRIYTSATIDIGINFWRAELTEDEAERARKIPEVASPPLPNRPQTSRVQYLTTYSFLTSS